METYRGFVMAQETDSNGHMNVQFYTQKYDQASGQFLARLGCDFEELSKNDLGFAYVESTIRYIQEVFEDQALHIETSILDVSYKVVTIKHKMKISISGNLVSECTMKWLLFDKKMRKSIELPQSMKEKIVTAIESRDNG